MARTVKRDAGKKIPKGAKVSTRPEVKERMAILESEVELEKLCQDFDVNDIEDIEDIVSGRVGEAEW